MSIATWLNGVGGEAASGKTAAHGEPGVIRSRDDITRFIKLELARTDRTGCEFSLVLFDDRLPATELAQAARRRARATDEIGYFQGPAICAVLTGTTTRGARRFVEDVAAALGLEARDGNIARAVHTYPSSWTTLARPTPARVPQRPRGPDNRDGGAGGNGHPGSGRPATGDGRVVDGNGRAGGENCHPGNGNGNGNGQPTPGNGRPVIAGTAAAPPASADRRVTFTAVNLLPALMDGVARGRRPADDLNEPLPALIAPPMPLWKRATDVVGAACGLGCLAPVMLVVAGAIKLTCRGPVIFRQVRAGKGGRPFVMLKFRTMCVDAEARQAELRPHSEQDGPAFKLKVDPRVTPLGRFLRKTSLDELPQLWNVLKGDMSLVGPRPLPWREACACDGWQRRRLDVTPGITCIWQVMGRSRVTFAEWMRMDIRYIRTRGVLRDLWLLLTTIPSVLSRRGAS